MDLEAAKRSLEDRLAELGVRASKIEADLRSPGSKDWTDRASEKENEEVLEKINASERVEIEQIRAALARIKEGTYGECLQCGDPIAPRRLEALPYTNTCIDCAS
ncbi:MAG: TraR/DksA family transcriptional regulator [Deltaproteobacteria bacterium]|jgi:RNA polymerase-binding protein DksA|nr:TraR/DksA family transcriptional regulator [Deltaproteobacteria bacterium]MBW2542540.1 TraR/DksA family transcriptional regulator [Deltaproteobacteria bacterium]